MKQLSAQDAQFLYMETNKSLSHVTSVAIFDPSTAPTGEIRFKQIIEHVQSRTHTSDIYKRRLYSVPLSLDYPYWIDDEHFDIEYHMRHGRLPHPSDWRQFCIHLARFHSRPLDMQRPPWEMYVIEGLDNIKDIPKGCYAVAIKIHHAAADGMSLVNFFGALMDMDEKGSPIMPIKKRINSNRFEKPTPMQMAARTIISNARSPIKMANSLMRYAPKIVQAAKQNILEQQKEAKQSVPQTRFNLETSPHRVFDSTKPIPIASFKPIRAAVDGATINDVVLCVCAGALRKYLVHHKELPSESLKAFVPVNVRAPKGSLAKGSSDSTEQVGNNISTMAPILFTDIGDNLERLTAIQAETQEQKAARKGISARLMTDVTRHIPASTQQLAARLVLRSDMAGRMTNVCISNVPGPDTQVYMTGARLVRQMALGPLADRMGLFIAVSSVRGELVFSVTSCRRTMPDVDFFIECINDTFNDLLKTAQQAPKLNKSSRNKKPTKKKLTEPSAVGTEPSAVTIEPSAVTTKPAANKTIKKMTDGQSNVANKPETKKTSFSGKKTQAQRRKKSSPAKKASARASN